MTDTADTSRTAALHYHATPKPGKLEVRATKPLANGRDLALAYSPGVAEASAVMGVSVRPGEMELARIPCAPIRLIVSVNSSFAAAVWSVESTAQTSA